MPSAFQKSRISRSTAGRSDRLGALGKRSERPIGAADFFDLFVNGAVTRTTFTFSYNTITKRMIYCVTGIWSSN